MTTSYEHNDAADLQLHPLTRPSDDSEPATTQAQSNTAVQSKSANDKPEPPPDGGLKAWLQVLGVFFIMFNTQLVLQDSYFRPPTGT